jgi:predicted polyphosphate/ATP-dependent NAD kinase
MRIGLIINPIAGLGGRVGLKGSDGLKIQQRALELGAKAQAAERAASALEKLLPLRDRFELVTPPGPMGADLVCRLGFSRRVIGALAGSATTAEDTRRFAICMRNLPVDLLLFAGGDGTARDVAYAVGTDLPVLGIPAGVKLHSAVFAINPALAGDLAWSFLQGERLPLRESEVLDLDEAAYRLGQVSAQLFGYLTVPYRPARVQNRKVPTPASESARQQAIAAAAVETMSPGWLYVLGPGTTTRAIAARLGFPKTLVGVDVVTRESVVASDVSEAQLLELLEEHPARIIVTPIGGQGFIFGRGNQPISPAVIRKAGKENILIVSPVEKLNALQGRPFLADTGDPETDRLLTGYYPVITGYREKAIYRLGFIFDFLAS